MVNLRANGIKSSSLDNPAGGEKSVAFSVRLVPVRFISGDIFSNGTVPLAGRRLGQARSSGGHREGSGVL